MSWLIAGLREAARFAKRNPDIAQHVHDHPSGFLSPSPCKAGCVYCKRRVRADRKAKSKP